MSRSISQIYNEAVAKRNSYLQVTELNVGRTNSKMSVLNIMTYVMAAMIYTYETILDVFEVDIAKLIKKRVNGTPQYYVTMAKYFQYNPITKHGDLLVFDEDTLTINYQEVDKTHRIVSRAAYESFENGIILKVCKDSESGTNTNGSAIYERLDETELLAFTEYIDSIKFIGAVIRCRSTYGDLVKVKAEIVYDNLYITEDQAFENVRNALIEYAKNLDFNGYVYYQSIIDAIQSAEHIIDVRGVTDESAPSIDVDDGDDTEPVEQEVYPEVMLAQFAEAQGEYVWNPKKLTNRTVAQSGYLTFYDETTQETTLKKETGYLTFRANA